eukprot:4658800-Karenia_brevis.AAC.1
MAYWCGLRVVASCGVTCLVIAVATILRSMVPHAMGRMRPLGLRSGITRAEARASSVSPSTRAVA